MARNKSRMSADDAFSLIDDDLPDGAFFAMAADLMGVDYGDVFDHMSGGKADPPPIELTKKDQKRLAPFGDLRRCSWYHYQIKRGGAVVADFWPRSNKYRVGNKGRAVRGNINDLAAALKGSKS